MKKLFSLLLALALVFSLSISALAASTNYGTLAKRKITENGKVSYAVDVKADPGSGYHVTDLFGDAFKNVMPGDVITTQIIINADWSLFSEDSIKIWITGAPSNPLHYDEKFENRDGKDQANIDGLRDETVDSNVQFLSQMFLTVENDKTGVKYLDRATADTAFATDAPVGTFRSKGQVVLNVTLEVPIEMGNEFANRVGEIDWKLIIEAYDDPYIDNPKTGDYILMAVAVMAASAAALAAILVFKRKKT